MHRDLVPDELRTQTRDLTQCRHEYDKLASLMQEDQEKKLMKHDTRDVSRMTSLENDESCA